MPPPSSLPVTIRDLATLSEFQECCAIQDETWGEGFAGRVPTAILHVSQLMGGVTAGAFDSNGRMVGFVFGMTGVRNGRLAHWSDMLAVREEARGQSIGQRLKHYQRDKVRELGVEVMYWTFDPLVARNAHFNLMSLGAEFDEYVVDMYGSNTGSALHGSIPTDRIIARWDIVDQTLVQPRRDPLRDEGSAALLNPVLADGNPALDANALGEPELRIQIPRDSDAVREVSEEQLLRWRLAVRESFQRAISKGYKVKGFVATTNEPGAALPYYYLEQT